MRRLSFARITVVLMFLSVTAHAQEGSAPTAPGAAGMYRLDFVLKEWDGSKTINSRNYSMVVEAPTGPGRTSGDLRAGTRVPVAIGSGGASPQFQYMDVGVNINCNLRSHGDSVVFNMSTEISSLAVREGATELPAQPMVRSSKASVAGVLTNGRPLLLSSVDDPASSRRFTIEVTPTKLR